jgi:hypothetical protein
LRWCGVLAFAVGVRHGKQGGRNVVAAKIAGLEIADFFGTREAFAILRASLCPQQ